MRLGQKFLTILAALIFVSIPASAHDSSEPNALAIVENYTKAYNAGDAEAMSQLMHNDIQWLTVKDDTITITSQGKSNMTKELTDYFKSPTTTTSSLSGWGENGDYISVVETASWTTKSGGKQAQSSNATYQIEAGLVRRVWYFPEQPSTPPN